MIGMVKKTKKKVKPGYKKKIKQAIQKDRQQKRKIEERHQIRKAKRRRKREREQARGNFDNQKICSKINHVQDILLKYFLQREDQAGEKVQKYLVMLPNLTKKLNI